MTTRSSWRRKTTASASVYLEDSAVAAVADGSSVAVGEGIGTAPIVGGTVAVAGPASV